MTKNIFSPLSFVAFLDPGSGMGKNQDPGSGINIPDPQHWHTVTVLACSLYLSLFRRVPFENERPLACWEEDDLGISLCLAPVLVCAEVSSTRAFSPKVRIWICARIYRPSVRENKPKMLVFNE
jgi:hypothetical protein